MLDLVSQVRIVAHDFPMQNIYYLIGQYLIDLLPLFAGSKELFSKVIFEKSTLLPANYTIIFKYIGSEFSNALTFAEVDTNKVPVS